MLRVRSELQSRDRQGAMGFIAKQSVICCLVRSTQITMTRRDYLELIAAGAAATATTRTLMASAGDADREARMKWWHEARFGMFIHWGLYSVLGRHEWVMENEGIPVAEYEQIAKRFKRQPNTARDSASLANALKR